MPFPLFSSVLGAFACSLRRVLLPASGLVLLAFAAPIFAQEQEEEDREPLTRREVSRALDLAEDFLDDAEKAIGGGDAEAAQAAYSSAGGWFLRVLEDYPDRHDVRLELARVYRYFEEWENIATTYSLAVEGLEDSGEILEAWTEMTNAYGMMEDDQRVIEAGQMVLELNPNPSADIYVSLAASMARQEAYDDAKGMAERALELAPDSAVAHSTLGLAAFAGGDMEAAETSFSRAVELDPETARAHAGLAEIYFAREDFQAAVDSATEALDRNDQLTAAYGIRGKANNALGNQAEAYGDLAMAITVNANDPAANLAFAQVYESQGNASQAENYYDRVTKLDNAPPGTKVEAYLALLGFSIENRDFDAAIQRMLEAVEAVPDSEEVQAGAGQAYYQKARNLREASQNTADEEDPEASRQERLDGALDAVGEALKYAPDDPSISVEHGLVLSFKDQIAEARPHLERGLPGFPEDDYSDDFGLAHYFLGQALMAANDFASAQGHFDQATVALPTWGQPFRMLAWTVLLQVQYGPCRLKDASFGERMTAAQVGCPASDADYQRVATAVAHNDKAKGMGVQDPALQERLDVLGEVKEQIEQ